MAAWIFHLRAAEVVLTELTEQPETESAIAHWYMGNLAPDCGVAVGFAEYVPPKDITHFKKGKHSCPDAFADAYLRKTCTSSDAYWFYLGYYVHLLTDVFWVENVLNPEKERFADLYPRDRKAFYDLVKADWYDQEILWLGERYEAGEAFEPLEILTALSDFPNRYLDFFPPDAFTVRLTSLRTEYAPDAILPRLPRVRREYPILSPAEEDELLKRFAKNIQLSDFAAII